LKFLTTVRSCKKWAQKYQGVEGIIHNDYIPGNVLFKEKTVSGVIDFDWACRGPLIKDLGISLATWSLPDGLDCHWEDVFEAFLEGYNVTWGKKILADTDLYRWICFSCLSDACTFLADLPKNERSITDVMQCRRYEKFLYFQSKMAVLIKP